MTGILVAQDYQDLTGQIIKKMINQLKVLEEELADLIVRFGHSADTIVDDEPSTLKEPFCDDDALLNRFGF